MGPAGATGPQGPQGIPGLSNYQRVSRVASIPASFYTIQSVTCPGGTRVLGGGVQPPSLAANDSVKIDMLGSYPSSDTTWTIHLTNELAVGIDLTIWAVCATAQ
jgi:hypothetical protein